MTLNSEGTPGHNTFVLSAPDTGQTEAVDMAEISPSPGIFDPMEHFDWVSAPRQIYVVAELIGLLKGILGYVPTGKRDLFATFIKR
ncbi:uncharacterized protein DSM5745_10713 [Aspergillus mulundensis]|uniref:Uncharacterized protein n=1 Tax=Aspergillus mulundensis TaxID=1810919 RepID=A0A3D8QHD0_9EURO|nr:hypothetical protein DSM5745_10713 [Aspergillus mulundensis]RDW61215.1 hypothetical protein DSM5745_10713 [Aspergillus mulundensis]